MAAPPALSSSSIWKNGRFALSNVYAVNVGGPALSGTVSWEADTSTTPSSYTNAAAAASMTYSVSNTIDMTHSSVPAGTPMALFQDERFDIDGGAEMQWDFPVTPGLYEVRLYFAEIYSGALSVNARVFDVSIEGTTVLDNYDVFAEVGGYKGVVKTFQVESNENLDIDFAHVTENPAIKAIQILSVTQANQLGVAPSSLSFGNTNVGSMANQTVTLTNLGSIGDPSIVIDATNLTGSNAAEFSDGFNDSADVTLAPGASTTVSVSFVPTSIGTKSASLSIVHSGGNSPITVPLTGTGTSTVSVGFGKSSLVGASLSNPTSLQFGPDGRLYVAQQNGLIKVYNVTRNAANNYAVTAAEMITAIQSIPNHNDNGVLNASETTRLVTGLLVTGTAANPVLYVTSSDPRIGAGPDGEDLNLDTNSGILSRLTWNGTSWVKVDLVRGLPRSEENHGPNGMALDLVSNILYIGQGGNTNMGAPSNNFALLPEYALSAAILSVDLNAIGNTTYDLPTLNDETRSGTTDANDPFGGNDGKNQAKLVPGGPVQVHASGFRNPYDVLISQAGKMYSIDNGPNAGWGDVPLDGDGNATTTATAGSATNALHEPGHSYSDNLQLIAGPGHYAGHPNPTRANLANTFNTSIPQSPVATANPVEGAYRIPGAENGALALFQNSTNGLVEYTASNFGGALKGDLLAASFSNQVFRMKLNAAGDDVVLQQPLFNSVGGLPLDIIAQGDSGPFAGTIWVADYEDSAIVVFEPNDYDPDGHNCTGHDDPALDEDGDGYNNHDEIVNGTSPCSAADVPPDWDQDFLSNLLDNDDDNDSRLDTSDPFAIDPSNGKSINLPVQYTWENDAPNPGGLINLGFTGLMTNGSANYESLFNPSMMTAGGAAGVVTIDAASEGDATGATNTQEYAFQFGVDVQPSSGPFTARTRITGPFAGLTPQAGQSMGLFIGTGDQDNYFKLIVSGATGGGVQWVKEVGGVVTDGAFDSVALPGPNAIDLYLTVDPSAATVQARYTVISGGVTGPLIDLGTPVAIPSSWWTGSMGLAVGIISSSAGPAPTFPATWDFLLVTPETTQTLLVSPGSLDFGNVPGGTTATQTLTLTNAGGPGDPAIVIDATTLSGVNSAQFSDSFNDAANVTLAAGASTTIDVSFAPSATGSRTATLSIAHSGANTPLTVPLAGVAEQASTGNVLITVTPSGGIDASTYNSNSFQITNNSGTSTKIQSVRFDLGTSLLPDVVFDPDGTAGDFVSKGFTPDSSSPVGLAGHTFLVPEAGGGYNVLDIQFSDFGPSEFFNFSVDIDPTSIKGANAPGPNESGSVSGLEMTGATVTVTYSDGAVQTTNLFRQAGSLSGSQAILKTDAPPQPGIQLLGAAPPVTLSNASQTVRVTGPVGATVVLFRTEGGLFTAGVPGGGFDLDPYEANSVIAVAEQTAVIGSAGYVNIPIILTKSQSDTGLNYLVATIKDAGGRTGPTSQVLVVQFTPAPPPANNQAPLVSAGSDQSVTLPGTASLQGAASDDGLPIGSTLTTTWSQVSGPGTVNFANPAAAVTSASFSVPGTYVLRLTASDGQLSSSDDLSVTINAASTMAVVSFTLINADTDLPIAGNDPFISGSTLNLATLPTRNLNVRANLSTTPVGSVKFALDADTNYRTENVGPYALEGDINGNFNPWTPTVGTHILTATPYSGANAGGTAGTPLTISFTIIDEAVSVASSLIVVGFPSPIQAGMPGNFTVTVLAQFGNVATGYRGTIHFTSSDIQADLPVDYTFTAADNGTHTFSATLKTAGSQTLTATDTTISALTSGQVIAVQPPASGDFNGDGTANAADYVVWRKGPGTIYTQTDYDNWRSQFAEASGGQGQAAAAAAAGPIAGTQTVSVQPAVASSLRVDGFPSPIQAGVAGNVTVTAFDAFGNVATGYRGTIHFTSSDNQAVLPVNYTFTAADNGTHTFSATFKTAGSQTLIAADTVMGSITGSQTITINAASTMAVVSFTLINADTDLPIAGNDPFISGSTLNLATLPTRNLNVRANLSTTPVGSVKFALDADTNYRTENVGPYALEGDINGNFNPWTPTVGTHILTATPYSGANAGGTAGTPLTISFTIIDNVVSLSAQQGETIASVRRDATGSAPLLPVSDRGRGSRVQGRGEQAILTTNKASFWDEAILSWLSSRERGRDKESLATDEARTGISSHDETDEVVDAFDQALSAMASAGLW